MMLAFSTDNFIIAALTDSKSDNLLITESSLAVILSNFSSNFKHEQHVVSEFSELAEPVLSRARFFRLSLLSFLLGGSGLSADMLDRVISIHKAAFEL